MKATKDFQYANQVFEVQLENAEWLETKQDGDTLYIEDNTYVDGYTDENGNFVKAADPIEFLPGGESSTGGGTTTDDNVGTVSQTEATYKTAVNNLVDARKAYETALAGSQEYQTALTNLETAQATEAEKQEAFDDEEAKLEEMNSAADDYLASLEARKSDTYQANLAKVIKEGSSIDDITAEDENGTSYYDATADASVVYADDAEVDEAFPTALADLALLKADGTAATNGETLANIKLTQAGIDAIEAGTWGVAASGTITLNVDGTTVKFGDTSASDADNIILSTADIATGVGAAGYIEFNDTGSALSTENGKKATEIKTALKALNEVEATVGDPADIPNALEIKRQEDAVTAAQTALEEAQKATKAAEEALEAVDAADAKDAAAKLAAAQDAREEAGLNLMKAVRNTGKEVSDAADAVVKAENGVFVEGDADYMDADDWTAIYNGTAVAANVDIEVGSETLHIKVTKKTNSTIIVETDGYKLQKDDEIRLPLFVRTTGGVASVSIDGFHSRGTLALGIYFL